MARKTEVDMLALHMIPDDAALDEIVAKELAALGMPERRKGCLYLRDMVARVVVWNEPKFPKMEELYAEAAKRYGVDARNVQQVVSRAVGAAVDGMPPAQIDAYFQSGGVAAKGGVSCRNYCQLAVRRVRQTIMEQAGADAALGKAG